MHVFILRDFNRTNVSSIPGLYVLICDWGTGGNALQQPARRHRTVGPSRRSCGDEREGDGRGHAAPEARHRPFCSGGEQRLHGAHVAHPGHHAHRHLLLLYHRILLSQGATLSRPYAAKLTTLAVQPPVTFAGVCTGGGLGAACDLQTWEGGGQEAGVWWPLHHGAAVWGRHQRAVGQIGHQHAVSRFWRPLRLLPLPVLVIHYYILVVVVVQGTLMHLPVCFFVI